MITRRSLFGSLTGIIPAFFLPKLKEEVILLPNGNKTFLLGNQRYRTENINGTVEWFYAGYLHREDGPAIIGREIDRPMCVNGVTGAVDPVVGVLGKAWYRFGLLHRENSPAIEMESGEYHWYLNGKRHRLDGPASVYASGSKTWWQDGKKHRIGGPAVESRLGRLEWWTDGVLVKVDGLL